jgi:sulfatase maturation enzyme AslB (radical SAM superfamily)
MTLETDIWNNPKSIQLRENNKKNIWDSGCFNCYSLEKSGHKSFRQGMNDGLGINNQIDLLGPSRLDLMFDISCNLACRTCGPGSSTYWQRHLKENKNWPKKIFSPKKKEEVLEYLKKINLSNLKQLVFCGGETLLGQEYWDVAEYVINLVPDAKNNLTICFQTNGTQPILERNFELFDRLFLVKLHVSLDGVKDKFEYLRWPASWNTVVENLFKIRTSAPSNTMFVIEETVSIFNIMYSTELEAWIQNNFNANREGDVIDHTKHIAHGIYNIRNLTSKAIDILSPDKKLLIPADWEENPLGIKNMIAEIKKIDSWRTESFENTFPELAECYREYL